MENLHFSKSSLFFRWNAVVEKAWLSLFRFIEFWMGLSYMDPDTIDSTLANIVKDPRLPGGVVDTEYVNGSSSGGPMCAKKSEREILADMMSDTSGMEQTNTPEPDRIDSHDCRPPWLK